MKRIVTVLVTLWTIAVVPGSSVYGKRLGKTSDDDEGLLGGNSLPMQWDKMPLEMQDMFLELNSTIEDLRGVIHLMESTFTSNYTSEEVKEKEKVYTKYQTISKHPHVKAMREKLEAHPKTKHHLETHDAFVNGDYVAVEKRVSYLMGKLPTFEVPTGVESHGRKLTRTEACKNLVEAIDKFTYYDFFVAFYKDDIEDDGTLTEGTLQVANLFEKISEVTHEVRRIRDTDYGQHYCKKLLEMFHYNIELDYFDSYLGQSVNIVQRTSVSNTFVSLKDLWKKGYKAEASRMLYDFTLCASSMQAILEHGGESALFDGVKWPHHVMPPNTGGINQNGKPKLHNGQILIPGHFYFTAANIFERLFNPEYRGVSYQKVTRFHPQTGETPAWEPPPNVWKEMKTHGFMSISAACSNELNRLIAQSYQADVAKGARGRVFAGGNIEEDWGKDQIDITCDTKNNHNVCTITLNNNFIPACSNVNLGVFEGPNSPFGNCFLGTGLCSNPGLVWVRFYNVRNPIGYADDFDKITALTIGDEPKDSGGTVCSLAQLAEEKLLHGDRPTTLYEPTSPVIDWQGAVDYCQSKGMTLGFRKDYCANGGLTFQQKEGDQWAPTLDSPNDWVQVGTSSHSPCKSHTDHYGPPSWGVDGAKSTYENNYILCVASAIEPKEVMPGYCCLDQPSDSVRGDRWGYPYQCHEECHNLAPVFAGFSAGACRIYSGTYCDNPRSCDKLVNATVTMLHEVNQTQGNSSALYKYLNSAPAVNDYNSNVECGTLREYFGFPANHIVDDDIIMDIQLLPESDRFKYLQRYATFMAGGGGGGSTDGDQVSQLKLFKQQKVGFDPNAADDWARANFALSQAVMTARETLCLLKEIECPIEGGPLSVTCVSMKNIAVPVAQVAMFLFEKNLEISIFMHNEMFGVGEYDMHDMIFKVEALYKNMDVLLSGLTIIDNRLIGGGGSSSRYRDLLEIVGERETDATHVWSHQKSSNDERIDHINERIEQLNEQVERMSENLETQTKILHDMMAQILTKMDAEKQVD